MHGRSTRARNGGLVYSTDGGRMCPGCRQPLAQCACACAAQAPRAGGDGVVRVSRESKGRGGKTVTVVRGLPLAAETLADMGRALRTTCGTGGTARDGALELQGDHVDRAIAWLAARGFAARRAGG